MNKNFHYNEAPAKEPIIFDIIFAEKVGGGLVKNANYDRKPGLAVSAEGECLKAAKILEATAADSTTVKVAKGHGFAASEYIAAGKKSVQISAIDTSHDDYDILSANFGTALDEGTALYQAKSASASSAKPYVDPAFVLGTFLPANCGDELAKLVNGANVRKETALFPQEVADLMKGIHLV